MSKNKLAKSPERMTFQKEKYLERKAAEGETPENSEEVFEMAELYTKFAQQKTINESDPEWQKNNLEYDLRSTDWILDKVKKDEYYAQNLYAALCNNSFQKLDVLPILKQQYWTCSWRYAGGIIADMREEGDYIDWYCSGIRDDYYKDDFNKSYVPESVVTDEIRNDLKQLGWVIIDEDQ